MKDTVMNFPLEIVEHIKYLREKCECHEPEKLRIGYEFEDYWVLFSIFYFGHYDREALESGQVYEEQVFYEFEKIMDKWGVIFVEWSVILRVIM